MAEAKVILGGQEYILRPLTIGQLRKLMPDFAKAAAAMHAGTVQASDGFEAAIAILNAAFSRSHQEVVVDDLEATPAEIIEAIMTIARSSGLVSAGEAPRAGMRH